MVSGPPSAGSVARTEPAANRSSGSSVRTSTMTSPRIPCGRPIRPTTSCMALADLVSVQEVDTDVGPAGQGADHGTQGLSGAPAPADDLAQVVGMNPDLQNAAPAQPALVDPDVVRVLDDALDQVLQRLFEHVSPRWRPSQRQRRPAPSRPARCRPSRCRPSRCRPSRCQP